MSTNQTLGVIAVGVAAVLLIWLGIVVVKGARRRRDLLRQWCARTGWIFTRKDARLAVRWQLPPLHGYGGATNVVCGVVPEGRITCCQHLSGSADGSATTRIVGAIDVGVRLPTTIVCRPRRLAKPHPSVPVPVVPGELQVLAADPTAAEEAARLLTAQALRRVAVLDRQRIGVYVALDGQEIVACANGSLTVDDLEEWIALLRGLATDAGLSHPTS